MGWRAWRKRRGCSPAPLAARACQALPLSSDRALSRLQQEPAAPDFWSEGLVLFKRFATSPSCGRSCQDLSLLVLQPDLGGSRRASSSASLSPFLSVLPPSPPPELSFYCGISPLHHFSIPVDQLDVALQRRPTLRSLTPRFLSWRSFPLRCRRRRIVPTGGRT